MIAMSGCETRWRRSCMTAPCALQAAAGAKAHNTSVLIVVNAMCVRGAPIGFVGDAISKRINKTPAGALTAASPEGDAPARDSLSLSLTRGSHSPSLIHSQGNSRKDEEGGAPRAARTLSHASLTSCTVLAGGETRRISHWPTSAMHLSIAACRRRSSSSKKAALAPVLVAVRSSGSLATSCTCSSSRPAKGTGA